MKTESFEGPFELLLALVTQQKVKIGSISISEVADQYMEHVQAMQDLDMDVASEFLVVASTLLAMKAKSLLPVDKKSSEDNVEDGELGDMTLEEATDLLVTRIIVYYQYKRVAAMLGSRLQNESMMYPRTFGPDQEFLNLFPDYLEGVSLDGLGTVCASLMAKRESFLLDAKHIAAKPIAVEPYVEKIGYQLSRKRRMTFDDVIETAEDKAHVVVSFLAILEMYKRGMVGLEQETPDDPISISYVDPSRWAELAATDSGSGGLGADAENTGDNAASGEISETNDSDSVGK